MPWKDCGDGCIVTRQRLAGSRAVLRQQARLAQIALRARNTTFKLDQVEAEFGQFVTRFEPILQQTTDLSPAEAFFVRTLLIHEYRKVLLLDPNMPQALIGAGWPSLQARCLCESLYGQLLTSSEAFLLAHVQTFDCKLNLLSCSSTKRRIEIKAKSNQTLT